MWTELYAFKRNSISPQGKWTLRMSMIYDWFCPCPFEIQIPPIVKRSHCQKRDIWVSKLADYFLVWIFALFNTRISWVFRQLKSECVNLLVAWVCAQRPWPYARVFACVLILTSKIVIVVWKFVCSCWRCSSARRSLCTICFYTVRAMSCWGGVDASKDEQQTVGHVA